MAELKQKKQESAAQSKRNEEFDEDSEEDIVPSFQAIGLSQEAISKTRLDDIGVLIQIKNNFRSNF